MVKYPECYAVTERFGTRKLALRGGVVEFALHRQWPRVLGQRFRLHGRGGHHSKTLKLIHAHRLTHVLEVDVCRAESQGHQRCHEEEACFHPNHGRLCCANGFAQTQGGASEKKYEVGAMAYRTYRVRRPGVTGSVHPYPNRLGVVSLLSLRGRPRNIYGGQTTAVGEDMLSSLSRRLKQFCRNPEPTTIRTKGTSYETVGC